MSVPQPGGRSRRHGLRIGIRRCIAGAVAALTAGTAAVLPVAPALAVVDPLTFTNPVVRENRKPGSTGWQVTKAGDDTTLQVDAYADRPSVNKGATITFHVTVNPPQQFRVEYWRMGWYGGRLGRLTGGTGLIDGSPQGNCMPPGDQYVQFGLIECRWTAGPTLTVPSDWVSGVYLAKIINAEGYQSLVPFVVRDDARSARIMIAQTSTTYQAYNVWPNDGRTGKSLYGGFGPKVVNSDGVRAVKVSYNRPYALADGAGLFFAEAIHTAAWFEQNGYDVAYADNIDVHDGTVTPRPHTVFVSPSHDEYWTKAMYDRIETSHQVGTRLAFLTANNIYWQTRMEPAGWTGQANRTMVVYRAEATDPVKGALATIRWRNLGRAEQRLLGSMYVATIGPDADWVVHDSAAPIHRGTGAVQGTKIPRMVGVEGDRIVAGFPTPPSPRAFHQLAQSPFQTRNCGCTGTTHIHQGTLYQASNGIWVFNSGTFNWPKGLIAPTYAHPTVQRMTTNLFTTLLNMSSSAAFRRMNGADRYATTAYLATDTFAAGVPVAYVATGEDFPDALVGGPAAARDQGPMLLTRATVLPSPTAAALSRLRPGRIVVVGRPEAVSDQVLEQLRAYSTSGRVDRVAGSDRYATAAAMSAATFPGGVPVAYVGNGVNFPDAMAGSAAGAALGGPVLLSEATALPAAVATELARLRPARIVVLGGPSMVSEAVEDQLASFAPTTRASGLNRYETAIHLSRDGYAPDSPPTVFIASGLSFPDALAAGAAAGVAGGPLILVGTSLSQQVATEVARLNPSRVVILGGTGAVPAAVVSQLRSIFTSTTYVDVVSTGSSAP
jgi:putative cell wall-binding protein